MRAAVLVKGTSIGVTTDFDGKFTLEVDPGQVLVVSYLGLLIHYNSVYRLLGKTCKAEKDEH